MLASRSAAARISERKNRFNVDFYGLELPVRHCRKQRWQGAVNPCYYMVI
jgi:hypothetical protein